MPFKAALLFTHDLLIHNFGKDVLKDPKRSTFSVTPLQKRSLRGFCPSGIFFADSKAPECSMK